MKLQPERIDGINAVRACDAHSITIHNRTWTESLLVPSRGEVRAWKVQRFEDLRAEHFDGLLDLQPELVIFGSGQRMRFVSPALLAGLFARRIGVETMTSIAACRTYNVLANENRHVVLAALLDA